MKLPKILKSLSHRQILGASGMLLLAPLLTSAQHAHITAGALQPVAGAKLHFPNGSRFAAETGYVVTLEKATNGPYAGYHYGTVTFTALPTSRDFGGPAAGAALPGTHIEAQVETVSGPAGGAWGFWEGMDEEEGTTLTFSVPTGTSEGTNRFPLSETSGAAGVDPYGHVHGRIFSATRPGLYRVGFRLIDTARNGVNGTPLHEPSELFHLLFQAGVTIAKADPVTAGLQLEFATAATYTYTIEAADQPTAASGDWMPMGDPVAGDDHLHQVVVPITGHARFFRLKRN